MPMAMAAPVFPAETSAWHSPSLQNSAATRREESRLRRSACDGGSAMPTTWLAWRTAIGRSCALRRNDLALDGGPVADQHGGESELAGRRHGALDDDGGAEVPAHGIHRDLHRPRTVPSGRYSPSTERTSRPL